MKVYINGSIYKVNAGWELDLRGDEQFNSGTFELQLPFRNALPKYTYVTAWESNDSNLQVSGLGTTSTIFTVNTAIKKVYLDITPTVINGGVVDLGGSNKILFDTGKIVIENATQKSETGAILTTNRTKIVIAYIGTRFEIFVDGIKQTITTPSAYVDSLTVTDVILGSVSSNFNLYDLRMGAQEITETQALKITQEKYDKENYFDYTDTEYVYTDFSNRYKVNGVLSLRNLGTDGNGDLSYSGLVITPVKEYNLFTKTTKSVWYDRLETIYKHTVTLTELTEYATEIKTPYMDLSNPLTGTPIFTDIQDMLEHTYNVAFPEKEGVNVGLNYTQELLTAMTNVNAFDIQIEESNLHQAWLKIYSKLNGYPTIDCIDNGQLTLGIKFRSKVKNEIEFNDYDDFEEYQPSDGYGTMGESRGINVVNNSETDNKNAYLYTEETPISFRSVTVNIREDNAKTIFFYPIEYIDSVVFYELDNPTNTVDLTPYIVLESEWQLLLSAGFTSGTTTRYKQNTIYYRKGGTALENWSGEYDRFLWWKFRTWREIILSAKAFYSSSVTVPSTWDKVGVIVNYRTRNDRKLMRIAKEDISSVNRVSTFQSNQSGNVVNSKVLGSVLHSDIQSLGNLITIYNKGSLESINDMYELNDWDLLTSSMIKAIKITGFSKSYNTVYTLSKDYQSISDNLDISAQVRQYDIPDGVDSLRYYEDYIEWNLEGIENNNSSVTADGVDAFVSTFGKSTALVKTNVDNVEISSPDIVDETGTQISLIVPIDTDGYRNTMEFYFGFTDPTFAYSKKITDTIDGNPAEVAQGVPYTKPNGSLDTLTLEYGKKYTATDQASIDLLPVVNATKFTGNPLVTIGSITDYKIYRVQAPVYYTILPPVTSDILFETINIPVINSSSVTESLDFTFVDNGVGSYTNTDITVIVTNLSDVDVTVGTFTFTYGEMLNIPIGIQVKKISIITDIQFTKNIEDILTATIETRYEEKTTVTSSGLKLSLGINDILRHTYFLHNVFYKATRLNIGDIVIGDDSMINNFLVGGVSKQLRVYKSDERYDKATDREFVKGTLVGSVASFITYGTQSVTFTGALTRGQSWAIADTNNRLLFAVNPPRAEGGIVKRDTKKTVSFNFVHFRTGLVREV